MKAVFDEAIKVVLKNSSGKKKKDDKDIKEKKKSRCNVFWLNMINDYYICVIVYLIIINQLIFFLYIIIDFKNKIYNKKNFY